MLNRNQLVVIVVGMLIMAGLFINYQSNQKSILTMDVTETEYSAFLRRNATYEVPQKVETRNKALDETKKSFITAISADSGATMLLVLLLANWRKEKKVS